VELLAKQHNRSSFDCGVAELTTYLRQFARQNQDENIGRTWVALGEHDQDVIGFYTLTVASVSRNRFSVEEIRRLPRYPVPVAHIGRLAVALSARGQGLGEHLLLHALEQIHRVSNIVPIFAVEVRAKVERAAAFYERYGFRRAQDDGLFLYLSAKKLHQLF
jgi:ribosomal protein S18 acetylase RimI-like enzyme